MKHIYVAGSPNDSYNPPMHYKGPFDQLRRLGKRHSLSLRTALSGLFGALAFLLGHLLAAVPNFELITLTLFLAGAIGGKQVGIFSGLVACFLHNTLNPLGPAMAPLLIAQLTGFAGIGMVGGLLFSGERTPSRWLIPLVGALLTLTYDILTTLAFAPFVELPLSTVFASGIPFTIAHVLGNIIIFSLATVFLGLGNVESHIIENTQTKEVWHLDT